MKSKKKKAKNKAKTKNKRKNKNRDTFVVAENVGFERPMSLSANWTLNDLHTIQPYDWSNKTVSIQMKECPEPKKWYDPILSFFGIKRGSK
jgi:hypothetical protein